MTPVSPSPARVNMLVVDRDGGVLAGGSDGKLTALPVGKPPVALGTSAPIMSLEQLADGTIISGGLDDQVIVRTRDGKEKARFKAGHYARVSPDKRTLATFDRDGKVALWDLATAKLLRELGKIERALSMAWSSTGLLAAIGADGTTQVWSTDGSTVRTIKPHQYGQTVAWSNNGKWLALGAGGHKLYAIGGEQDRELRGMPPSANIMIAEFTADDSKVLLAGTGFLGVWEVATGEPKLTVATSALIPTATFLDGERYIAAGGGDRRLRVWDASTGAELLAIPMPANVFRLFPDPTRTILGITTARGAAIWRRPSYDGDLATLRKLAECRSSVEIHETHIRGRTIDTKACNQR